MQNKRGQHFKIGLGVLLPAVVLEICADSPASINAARIGGGQRLELCSALALGGLTPGPGLTEAARASGLPFAAMARPRPGGLTLDVGDLDATLRDAEFLAASGACAIVFGAVTHHGTLDAAALREVASAAGPCPIVLHRAIDMVEDWRAALESAIGIGIARILTSGGPGSAPQGAARIAEMVKAARGRIEIMAGGGIRPETVARMLSLGVDAIHGSASHPHAPHGAEPIGIPPSSGTCTKTVAAMRAVIDERSAAA